RKRRTAARMMYAMPDSTTTVATLRESLARFVAERDWEQFHSPKNLAMALAAEAAELMEHFLWIDNETSCGLVRDPARRGAIADEIADVAGVIFALCNALDLDLSDAVADKMSRNVLKYPVEKCRGRYRVEEE
ncbi:MAG: MazG-like family protein, partial [Gemmataceae bacterium]